jgi:hypothetical protein
MTRITAEEVLDLQGLVETVFASLKWPSTNLRPKAATQDQKGMSFDMEQCQAALGRSELGETCSSPHRDGALRSQPNPQQRFVPRSAGAKSTTLTGSRHTATTTSRKRLP